VRPASYSVPDDIRATVVRLIAYMGALAAIAVAAMSFFQSLPSGIAAFERGQPAAPRSAWTTAEHPLPAFELLIPDLASSTYAIQRRASDGARKDVLTWGDVAAAGPYALVEIYRPGVASDRFLDASSEIATRIIDYTVTDDVKPDGFIDSKFGQAALVDFAIAPQGQDLSHLRRCLGFARAFSQPALQIAGWYCSAGREVIDRATVGCMIDRLTLVNGDTELDKLFARAEVKRTFCGQRSPIMAATPERGEQIAPRQPAKLKAALRGRMPTH
jgi:hypothetical protein